MNLAGRLQTLCFWSPTSPKKPSPRTTRSLFAEFKAQADKGNTRGFFYVGAAYMSGVGTPMDHVEGAKWIKKSADLGNPSGISDYGLVVQLGQGVPLDRVEAQKWNYISDAARPEEQPFLSEINAKYMSEDELKEARTQADAWLASH